MSLVGFKAVTYRDTANNYASPTWSAVGGIRDNTLNGDKSQIEGTTRDSGKFMEWLAGHIDAGVEFTYRPKPIGVADPHTDALIDSWLNSTPLPMFILDDLVTTVGAKGLRAYCEVFNFNRSEPIEGAVEYSYTLKPSANNSGHPPEWVTIT